MIKTTSLSALIPFAISLVVVVMQEYLPRVSLSGFSASSGEYVVPDPTNHHEVPSTPPLPQPMLQSAGEVIRHISERFAPNFVGGGTGGGKGRRSVESFSLSWHAVSLTENQNHLLRNVSGCIKSGTVAGVVSSGDTKNLVALFETISSSGSVSGSYKYSSRFDVRVNDKTVNTETVAYRKRVTFLRRGDDILPIRSTLRESLMFHARFNKLSSHSADRMVKKIIRNLKLEKCQDVRIQNLTVPERARTRVAIALVSRPSALLLDNPLSGLDVYEAFQTVSVLRQVAVDLNTAVLISIDQPSSEVLFALDEVTFISRGSVVFSGNPSDIVSYFLQMGYDCPPSYSPSDYLLFLLEVVPLEEHERLVSSWQWHRGNELMVDDHHAPTLQALMEGIRQSLDEADENEDVEHAVIDENYRKVEPTTPRSPVTSSPPPMSPTIVSRAVDPIESLALDDVEQGPPVDSDGPSSPSSMGTPVSRIGFGLPAAAAAAATGDLGAIRSMEGGNNTRSLKSSNVVYRNNRLNFVFQFIYLYQRELKFFVRSFDTFVVRLALFAILSALVALMLFEIGTDAVLALTTSISQQSITVLDTILNDYYGAISIMILLGLFGNVERVSVAIPSIRALFLAEHGMARLYGLGPFLFSQIFVELPMTMLMSIVQMSISYWIIGFVGNFFIWVLIVFLGSVATSSVGWLICSVTYSPLTALQLVPVIVLPQILFSGLLIDIRLIPSWLAWMEYLCYLKYCINVAVINETASLQDYAQIKDLASQNYISLDKTGTYVSIICIFIVGARLLAAMALHYNRKIISWNL